MGNYHDLALQIIEDVGGKENIRSLAHCITRLRFKETLINKPIELRG